MRRLYVLLAGLMMILAGSRSIHAASTKTSPVTLRSIRMVNTRFGWGISRTHILRTSDGGRLWWDVTPPAYKPRNLGSLEGWTMLDARHAWVVGADPRPQHTEMGSRHATANDPTARDDHQPAHVADDAVMRHQRHLLEPSQQCW